MTKQRRFIISLFALLSFSCFSIANPNKAIFLIPEGFTGGVIILYNQPDGIVPETADDGTIIYRIPKDGFLKVKPPLKKVAYKFNYYYVDANDKRTEIEYVYPKYYVRDRGDTTSKSLDSITEDERNNGVFVMNHRKVSFGTNEDKELISCFSIGNPKNSSKLYDDIDDRIDEIGRRSSKNETQTSN